MNIYIYNILLLAQRFLKRAGNNILQVIFQIF